LRGVHGWLLMGGLTGGHEGIGHTTQSRSHDKAAGLWLMGLLVKQHAATSPNAIGCGHGGSSEFQNVHGGNLWGTTLRIVEREVAVRIIIYAATVDYPSSLANLEMTSMLTPVLEKPPSWKRFCMVTYRVRSLKSVAQ